VWARRAKVVGGSIGKLMCVEERMPWHQARPSRSCANRRLPELGGDGRKQCVVWGGRAKQILVAELSRAAFDQDGSARVGDVGGPARPSAWWTAARLFGVNAGRVYSVDGGRAGGETWRRFACSRKGSVEDVLRVGEQRPAQLMERVLREPRRVQWKAKREWEFRNIAPTR